MNASKYLSDAGWKDVSAKSNVKDNGLLKTLAELRRLGEDKYDQTLNTLSETVKLADQLKKDRKTAPAAGKYLDEMLAAADNEIRVVTKAKAAAEKSAKAKAHGAQNRQAMEDGGNARSSEVLGTKLKPLLRQVARGQTLHALVSKSGQRVAFVLSRKPIPPASRKMLVERLGGGGIKHYAGLCRLEDGATTFVLNAEVAGLSKLLKQAVLEQTGVRLHNVACRAEDGDVA